MKISVEQQIPFSRSLTFETLRDHLPRLQDYLPNIQRIEVREREELSDDEVRLVNYWKAAKTEVPVVARAFLDPSKLAWLDHSLWSRSAWSNTWKMDVNFMRERVDCHGTTRYIEDGADSTRVIIEGVLDLDLKGLLPGLLARRAGPKVESFVVNLIKPNFERVNEGLVKYLRAQRG